MTQSHNDSILLICPSCGYDLRAIPSERCPECGTTIDRTAMAVSTIPWAHRKAIGLIRAYWRTLILATFRMRKLGEEINRPVDLREASRFRWITIAIASVLPIVLFMVAICLNGGTGFLDLLGSMKAGSSVTGLPAELHLVLPYAAGITRWIVLPLALILWLGMISGFGSYWFSPRSKPSWQRDRAVGLSLYASSAPLLWFTLALVIWGVSAIAMALQDAVQLPEFWVNICTVSAAIGVLLACVVALLFWINLLRLLGFTLHAGSGRSISMAIALPVAFYFLSVIAFGLFPWVAGFVWLMIDSLR